MEINSKFDITIFSEFDADGDRLFWAKVIIKSEYHKNLITEETEKVYTPSAAKLLAIAIIAKGY